MSFESVCEEISWLHEPVRANDLEEFQLFSSYLTERIFRAERAAQEVFSRHDFTMNPFPHFPYYCVTGEPERENAVCQDLRSIDFEEYILSFPSGMSRRGQMLVSFSVREEKWSGILMNPLEQIIPHDLVRGWSQEDQLRELNENPPGRFWPAFFKVYLSPISA